MLINKFDFATSKGAPLEQGTGESEFFANDLAATSAGVTGSWPRVTPVDVGRGVCDAHLGRREIGQLPGKEGMWGDYS